MQKYGYTEEQIANVPETINLNEDLLNELKFSNEEIQSLVDKYFGIIVQGVSQENFSKQSNQIINIKNQAYTTNAYILTLTKEQLNNIYINILQNLKEDEIILSKLDVLKNKTNMDLKESLKNKIDIIIQKINQSNIGIEETKIIVYENNGQAIRTSIETPDYQTNVDFLLNQYAELSVKNGEQQIYKISLNNDNENLSIEFENNETIIRFEENQQIENQKRSQKSKLTYKAYDIKAEINIVRNTEIVENIKNVQNLNNENAIILNNLSDEQSKQISDTVKTGLSTELERIKQEINYQDIEQMLKDVGIIRNSDVLNSSGITETEKNRFNSTFELLQGENLSGEDLINSIQTIKNNIGNMEIISNTELRLNVVRNNPNQEVVDRLTEVLKQNKNRQYNMKLEYDKDGLVNQVILIIVEKQ